MEDFEKYVFDPENPTAFKAYGLLLNIIRKKNNYVLLDRVSFIELFKNDIFDRRTKELIWDIPGNYNSLDSIQKTDVFIKNYSENEFILDLLSSKDTSISNNNFNSIFEYFIFFNKILSTNNGIRLDVSSHLKLNYKLIGNIIKSSSHTVLKKHSQHKGKIIKFTSTKNSIYFLFDENHTFDLSKSIQHNRASVVITLIKNQNLFNNLPDRVHPIFIKKISDLSLLFNYIKQNISKEGSKNGLTKLKQKVNQPVQKLSLKNYFTIKNIQLENLQDKKEIYFLGKNGVGKTKLLQAILLAIRGNPNEGIVSDVIKENPNESLSLISTFADGTEFKYQSKPKKDADIYRNIIAYGVNRFRNDSEKKDDTGFLTLFDYEQYLHSPVQWLKYLDYKELTQDFSGISLEEAKDLIKDILEDVTNIEVSPEEVLFYEGDIPRKITQLSDGFKTLITWLCDMTIRLAQKQPHATSTKEFSGIVMVDEIGVFLHPTWQYSLMDKVEGLRSWFPNIQFIFTTHSPIEILGASRDAVFYKLYKEDGITKVSTPVENKSISHLMLNGIVTAPFLFGLPSAKQAAFDENQDNLDTSDDYYEGRIREELLRRVTEKENVTQEDMMKLLNEAFDEVENELILNDKD